jgi:hypothetical protein
MFTSFNIHTERYRMALASPRRAPRPRLYLFTSASHPEIRTIIGALVNGVDICLVEPSLYPALNAQLEAHIPRFQDAKDEFAAERCIAARRYITQGYPEELERARILSFTPKPTPPKPQPYTQEQLGAEVARLLEGNRSSNYDRIQCEAIVDELKERRKQALESENYIAANGIEEAIAWMLRHTEAYSALKLQEEKAADLSQKLDEARQNLTDLRARWEAVFQTFRAQKDADFAEMCESSQESLRAVESQKKGAMPAKFKKYSPHLMNLKARERAMVAAKRYDDACDLHAELRALRQTEKARCRADWIAAVDDQLEKLSARFDQAMQVRTQNFENDEQQMIRERDVEIQSAMKQIEHLEMALEKLQFPDIDDNPNPSVTSRGALPLLDLPGMGRPEARSPKTIRQRRLLAMKIYTRLPPKTARAGTVP